MMSLRDALADSTVGAFNFNDQFDLAGIVRAAENACEPVVALISERAIEHSSSDWLGMRASSDRRRHATESLSNDLGRAS